MMAKVRTYVAAAAVLTAATLALYRFGLSEDAREQLRGAARSVRDAYGRVEDVLSSGGGGHVPPEDLPNRRATEAEWEALGL